MNADPASLDRLHDVIAPPVAWWPPAPGWYVLLVLLFVLGLVFVLRGLIRWQHNRYRREALAEWRKQSALLSNASTRGAALAELAILLKRTALSAFPRTRVAALTGPSWRAFLDETGSTRGFSSNAGVLLERAAYGVVDESLIDEADARESAALVRHWLTTHDAEGLSQEAAA